MNEYTNRSLRVYVLIAATLSSFLTPFMGSSINVALPVIALHFGIDAILQTWIPTAFLLAAAIFAVPFGRISEIYGMKRIFIYGNMIFTVSSVLSAFSPSALALIIFRAIQGVGSAMIFVTGLAMLTRVFPPMERGKAIGINTAAVYIGLSMGPVLGGFLTHFLGWQSIFLVTVPVTLIVLAVCLLKVEGEWADASGESFDVPGSISYCIFLFLLMYGFSALPEVVGALMIVLSILAFAIFLKIELSSESPVFNVRLFKNLRFSFSSLAALINYSATFAVSLLLSYHLQYIKGLDPGSSGLILVTQPIVMAFVAPLAGRASDRFNPQILAGIGMAINAAALLSLSILDRGTPLFMIVTSLLVLGLGFGFFSSPNTNAIMGSVERRDYGIASATVSSMRLIGQAFSIGIVTLIFAFLIGRVPISPANYDLLIESTRICFLVFGVLCFIGVFAATAHRNDG
ncbi:MFS transporter [Methanothermobacter marburgensis]|uniref:Predicted efflux pump protein n=1 Tax=Methanothermobacter marburgensis (strain ATCC BAA-927 / DSM 2133 / JCM 14651 / NBRC 100331 / OCM 82 / Marburg) TaxID=79929 RepID=D9PVJ3_METTM|nr:MFS transporter [Methanothermobacter marburgensis]ADL58241.1 predicted efflux pump protein [Methanothermobacter marburgensis str. Marburg]WBF10408.1 MFS transporter [Methanothermobacter marburgensis]